MSCMNSFAQSATVTTIQLVRACCDHCDLWHTELTTKRKLPLNMSWVVVTDEMGKRQLRMRWTVAEAEQR
jgi:hypothetical protein